MGQIIVSFDITSERILLMDWNEEQVLYLNKGPHVSSEFGSPSIQYP